MMGARFGTVVRTKRNGRIEIKHDHGMTRTYNPEDLTEVR
jgi:hypothetical protein